MNLRQSLDVIPEEIARTGQDDDYSRGFTLALCFSRAWAVKPFFERFRWLRIPLRNCNLLIFNNAWNPELDARLKQQFDIYKNAFRTARYYWAKRVPEGKLYGSKDEGFEKSKLPVIYGMERDLTELVLTKKFVMLEDDTLVPKNAVCKLLNLLERNKRCGLASAIETGRAPFRTNPVRLGVHYIEREGDRILTRVSLPPNAKGIKKVDATGWYCVASYTDLWRKALDQMLPLLREHPEDCPRFALDNFHTNNIKNMGYDLLADFSLWCRHMQVSVGRIIEWGKEHAIPMADVYLPRFDAYAQGIPIRWSKTFEPKKP